MRSELRRPTFASVFSWRERTIEVRWTRVVESLALLGALLGVAIFMSVAN
jgi:hypothetical protein